MSDQAAIVAILKTCNFQSVWDVLQTFNKEVATLKAEGVTLSGLGSWPSDDLIVIYREPLTKQQAEELDNYLSKLASDNDYEIEEQIDDLLELLQA
jgi:adenylate kinase family enzyme